MAMSNVTLCVSNAYQKKFYLNENFNGLPGGILELYFDEDGSLQFQTSCEEQDYFYDEIGSVLKIKQYQNDKRDLLEAIETYYRVLFLGEGLEE